MLQALGWDLYDPEEVNREYRRRGADNPVDYALLLLRTPRLFAEPKASARYPGTPRPSTARSRRAIRG
jgi:predicted type IV restriction endonuclease